MSLALSVTYEAPGTINVPGYLITVSGLSSVSGAFTVNVTRHNNVDGSNTPVRGLTNVSVVGDTAISTDYEYQYYNDNLGFTYIVQVLDVNSAVLASTGSSTLTGTQSRNDLRSDFPQTTAVISSIQSPALSLPIIVQDLPSWDIQAAILGTYKVLGRPNPVVLTDVFGGRTGTLEVIVDSDVSTVTFTDFNTLITFNDTLMFQPYFDSSGFSNMYFKVTDVNVARLNIAESQASTSRLNSTVLIYTIGFTEVDMPSADSAAFTTISWQDVVNANTLWSDVQAAHTTWLDVLNNPTA